jgi:hypothetical protein
MILLQSGFGLLTTNWITSCVSSTSFAVLINGRATPFFQSGRGLQQGCPLSPLLFVLVMEGLSLLLKQARSERKLTGVKVSRMTKILNLFFLDSVIFMTSASVQEWKDINSISFPYYNDIVQHIGSFDETAMFRIDDIWKNIVHM